MIWINVVVNFSFWNCATDICIIRWLYGEMRSFALSCGRINFRLIVKPLCNTHWESRMKSVKTIRYQAH